MKRKIALCLACILVCLTITPTVMADGLKYRYQANDLIATINDSDIDSFVDKVEALGEEHPLIMSAQWKNRLLSLADQYVSSLPEVQSEYDLFDDITYLWFGDSRKANEDDPCVIISNQSGWVLSFYFTVDKWITVSSFTAVTDTKERITGEVINGRRDNDAQYKKYESFEIKLSSLNWEETPKTLAFRFYGKNKDDHIDYNLDEEEVSEIIQVKGISTNSKALTDAIREWVSEVDSITDESIPPANYHIFLKNDYPIFPSDTTSEDMHKTVNTTDRGIKEALEDFKFKSGSVYFLPCVVEEITEPFEATPQRAWIVKLKSRYNTNGGAWDPRMRIVVDHALEMGWVDTEPAPGDEVILIATYLAYGGSSGYDVFFLGSDAYIDSLVESVLKK